MLHFNTLNFLHYYQYACFLLHYAVSQSPSLFLCACLLFCSLNRLLPLKVLIHSHTIFLTLFSLCPSLLLLLLSLSLFLLLLWARDSWRCPLIWSLPDSDTKQLDVVRLPLVPSKHRDTVSKSRRDTHAQTEYCDGNVLCQHRHCDPQSM